MGIVVCSTVGMFLIIYGALNMPLGIILVGLGILVIIFGFEPKAAKSIITEIGKIVGAFIKMIEKALKS